MDLFRPISEKSAAAVENTCSCGYTRDESKNCDGTHKVVRKLRKEIAQDILLMDCPTITGEFVDSWHMFRHVRNKAMQIAEGKND